MRGASALDHLLAEFPDADLRVQVVWEPVLRSDIAAPMSRTLRLLDDGRTAQYWDPERTVSADILRAVNGDPPRYGLDDALPPDFIVWDVVAVFPRSDRWDTDLPTPAYYGGPVVDVVDAARKAIAAELVAPAAATRRGDDPRRAARPRVLPTSAGRSHVP